MTDGAAWAIIGLVLGAGWTWFLVRALQGDFAAERAKHIKERDTILRALGQYETRLQQYEAADIPPEEM